MRAIRAAAHVHSEWSYDGRWPLPRIAQAFGRRGYRVVLTAEHDRGFDARRWQAYRRACQEASTDQVLLVPGIEYSDATNTVHVPTWGVPFVGEGLATSSLLAVVREYGGVAVMAHPARRRAWTLFQPEWSWDLAGIEIWNRKTDGWAPSREALRLMAAYPALHAFVGIDFHTRRQFFPLAMRLKLSGAVSEEAVLEALRLRQLGAEALTMPAGQFARSPLAQIAQVAERGRRPLTRMLRDGLSLASSRL